jgi:hypothetical protein
MKGFWVIVCLLLLVAFIGLRYLPTPRVQRVEYVPPPTFERLAVHVAPVILIAVLWGICFRGQLEKFKFSLLSIFALGTMEAIWLGLHHALFDH